MYNSFNFESEENDRKLKSADGIDGDNGSHSDGFQFRDQNFSQVNKSRDISDQCRFYIYQQNDKMIKSVVLKPSSKKSKLCSFQENNQRNHSQTLASVMNLDNSLRSLYENQQIVSVVVEGYNSDQANLQINEADNSAFISRELIDRSMYLNEQALEL